MVKKALHISAVATMDAPVAPIPEPNPEFSHQRHPTALPLEVFYKLPAESLQELFTDIEKAAKTRNLDRLLNKISDWAAAAEYFRELRETDVIIGYDPATGNPIYDWPENLARATLLASIPALERFWNTPEEDAAWRDL